MLGYIEQGKAEGARCLVGGGPATQFEKGYFVQPTLFVDVDPDSTIAQEEIFGPVLSVIPFDDDDDAVRIANNSRYGLSGSIASGSLDRALGGRPPDPHRYDLGERRPVVRARHAVRRLQGERFGPGARRPGLRGVPRDQVDRPAGLASSQKTESESSESGGPSDLSHRTAGRWCGRGCEQTLNSGSSTESGAA